MSGTLAGGAKAAATNKRKYGEDYYVKRAYEANQSYMSKPKAERKPRGFAANPERARAAGAKGGALRRRAGIPNKKTPPVIAPEGFSQHDLA